MVTTLAWERRQHEPSIATSRSLRVQGHQLPNKNPHSDCLPYQIYGASYDSHNNNDMPHIGEKINENTRDITGIHTGEDISTHTGEKKQRIRKNKFLCTMCLKSFCDVTNYRYHCRIHTGEKPY
ncbi:unnamed protein product, partial [Owenia fusiformis]